MFIGLHAEAWSALGQMLLGLAAVVGGARALYIYNQSRKHEAATWLQGIYRDFYQTQHFTRIRRVLEYHYKDVAGPLLSRLVATSTNAGADSPPSEPTGKPTTATTRADEELLAELDMLLNYFELVLYLEDRRQFTKKDRPPMLDYWLDLMGKPDRKELQEYAATFKFTRVARALGPRRTLRRRLTMLRRDDGGPR